MLNSKWLKNLWTNFLEIYSCTIYFASIFLKVMQLSMLVFEFWRKKMDTQNFEFSQKFPVKSRIFLHIYLIPIMYESWKLKKVKSNKILFRAILEQCELKMPVSTYFSNQDIHNYQGIHNCHNCQLLLSFFCRLTIELKLLWK